tara:strand:+ start:5310 stop:7433 length:2124 start_codon:yes stop_codon:yes gene_type:complete
MARISTYTIDSLIEGSDKLLGTDANSSSALATKNYTIDSLKAYITGDQTTAVIPDVVPLGFFLSVNREGTAFEKAQVRTLAGSVLTNVVLKSSTVNTGADIYLNTLGTGQVFLIIRDYNDGQFGVDFDFQAFADNSATFTGVLGGVTYTGTVTSFNPGTLTSDSPAANDSKYVTSGGNKFTEFCFNVTLDSGQTYTGGQVAFTSFTFLTGAQQVETQIVGGLKITRGLNIEGDVVIGTDTPDTDPQSLTVHGPIKIKDTEGSIEFGDTAPNVTLTTDGTNLNIGGNGTNVISNSTRFTQDIVKDTDTTANNGRTIMGQNSFTAINTDGTRSVLSSTGISLQNSSGVPTGAQIVPVAGNPSSLSGLTDQGTLSQLQVGTDYYDLPELTSGVAVALPGLSEALAGPSGNITMGRLFYGIRQSNGALFQAATSPASFSGITISSGATSVVLSSSNHTAIKTLLDATPANQALYFVESTYTTAFPSVGALINDTSVNIYQIVSEVQSNLSITFGKQGNGIITINTSQFNVNSEVFKLNDIPNAAKTNFLQYDTSTKAVSHSAINITAAANGVTYDFGGNNDVPVASINFDNLQITAPANGQVVLKQGYAYGGALTANTTVENFKHYILDAISADKTVSLPAGTAGSSIRFTNMSSLNSAGGYVASSYCWTINPNGSEKIMRSTSLVLDESTASFELFYSDATNGWIVNGLS